MRFMTRSLLGIFVLCLTLGLLLLAGSTVFRAIQAKNNEEPRRRAAEERVFAVNVDTITLGEATPVITAFGEVASWRMLEIRAATSGTVVELAPTFRDGGRVVQGETLVRIDPANAQSALSLAETETAEAEAELSEAEAALLLARDEMTTTTQQRDLRAQALLRQQDLLQRGAGTTTAVETAELSLSSAEQTLVGRRQALAQAEARINRARIALDRQRISLAEAERVLSQTTITAPFSGLLSDVSGVLGGLVSTNEILGTLIDPDALEVAFRVSNAQFSRLIDDKGALRDVHISATLSLEDIPITVTGRVDRVGARVGDGQTGRLLYARLDAGGTIALRPGDFMVVEIEEPPLTGVAVIPAAAINSDREMLLIGADDRLEMTTVDVLRRQGDYLIVGSVPEGAEYATERLPQIGEGVKVRPVRAGEGIEAPEMVQIDPDQRARMMATVEANTRLPEQARDRILKRLQQDEVPAEMVARFDPSASSSEAPPADGNETLALDSDRRAKLIAFVEGNSGMPADAKARLLAQLNSEQVPRDMVERLENRIGG